MRWLCSLAGGRSRSYAERFPSLLDPLPDLHLPPDPNDEHQQQSPPPPHTEVTTLPNGVRIASQDIPLTHMAMGFEVPGGWRHEKASVIMQALMGGGASFSNGGPGKGLQSRLYLWVMTEYVWMQAISAFSTVYDDTALFGIHLAALQKLSSVERKNRLFHPFSKPRIHEDIGRQILIDSSGKASGHILEGTSLDVKLRQMLAVVHRHVLKEAL